jgi:hypothetical protein
LTRLLRMLVHGPNSTAGARIAHYVRVRPSATVLPRVARRESEVTVAPGVPGVDESALRRGRRLLMPRRRPRIAEARPFHIDLVRHNECTPKLTKNQLMIGDISSLRPQPLVRVSFKLPLDDVEYLDWVAVRLNTLGSDALRLAIAWLRRQAGCNVASPASALDLAGLTSSRRRGGCCLTPRPLPESIDPVGLPRTGAFTLLLPPRVCSSPAR